MKEGNWLLRKGGIIILAFLLLVIAGGDFIGRNPVEERDSVEKVVKLPLKVTNNEQLELEKGYNLPITDREREKAEADCQKMMEIISDIYKKAKKGMASNDVITNKTVRKMQDAIKETKLPVISTVTYSNMHNYKKAEDFLKNCLDGKSGSIVIYEIHNDGGIGRYKFSFDGTNLYVLGTKAIWNDANESRIVYVTYNRIKKWNYTEKGWFCYELCVPEPPEVTEIVDGCCMIRVKPMKEEYRKISEKCVLNLGYQGNNLLYSNWDSEHLEALDYNGIYEYLYEMKYRKKISSDKYINGIPREEFENVIMSYLPVTSEQIQSYAIFNKETQTYTWAMLGCLNSTLTFFSTSTPEVVAIKENEDGTFTLTVDAVCVMILCDDAVITHELTVRFLDDGSFQYLGNKVLGTKLDVVPEYQYRIGG